MTAEWLHLPPPYPPGVGPLCGAELEAWYEDLQDILGSDAGGAKVARAPTCTEVSSVVSKLSGTHEVSRYIRRRSEPLWYVSTERAGISGRSGELFSDVADGRHTNMG